MFSFWWIMLIWMTHTTRSSSLEGFACKYFLFKHALNFWPGKWIQWQTDGPKFLHLDSPRQNIAKKKATVCFEAYGDIFVWCIREVEVEFVVEWGCLVLALQAGQSCCPEDRGKAGSVPVASPERAVQPSLGQAYPIPFFQCSNHCRQAISSSLYFGWHHPLVKEPLRIEKKHTRS